MLPKIAHVIIIGLSEEERAQLDQITRNMLFFSDPEWQYTSYECATLRDAVEMAKGMERVDILFVAREIEPCGFASERTKYELTLVQELMREHPSKPVLSYDDQSRDSKLAIAIFALWRDRNKAAK